MAESTSQNFDNSTLLDTCFLFPDFPLILNQHLVQNFRIIVGKICEWLFSISASSLNA